MRLGQKNKRCHGAVQNVVTEANRYPVHSPLSQRLSRDGTRVEIQIYEDGNAGWLLEVVDEFGNSTVWDDSFLTDQAALAEALKTIESEGIASVLGSVRLPPRAIDQQLHLLSTIEPLFLKVTTTASQTVYLSLLLPPPLSGPHSITSQGCSCSAYESSIALALTITPPPEEQTHSALGLVRPLRALFVTPHAAIMLLTLRYRPCA